MNTPAKPSAPAKPEAPSKPASPLSRLGRLAAVKVVSAGEAFARDLQPTPAAAPPPAPAVAVAPRPTPASTVVPRPSTKRTFRFPRDLDAELKRFVHRYNLEKSDGEPELTMDEVGVVMARYFLQTDPRTTTREARGLVA